MTIRKLVSVQKIIDIRPIPGANLISAYKVQGWWVVDQINKYSIGDLVLYAEIDSWIPTTVAPFLSKNKAPREYFGVLGERLRTVRLKGQLSQGLLIPITIFTNFNSGLDYQSYIDLIEGDDVTKYLGVQQWELPIHPQLAGIMRGNFPTFIQKTDQIRIQNIQADITESFINHDEFEVTIKLDGSSCTAYFNDGDVGVCSRNINLKLDQEGNAFVDIVKSTGLLTALEKLGKNIAVQGELMGPGIQGNKEKFAHNKLFVFDIFNIDTQRYLTLAERMDTYVELYDTGECATLDLIPIHSIATLPTDDIGELLKLAEGQSICANVREGVVFKRIDGTFSFKIINNEFLINEK
jgi:RNA ligase (TIGR02306 family)